MDKFINYYSNQFYSDSLTYQNLRAIAYTRVSTRDQTIRGSHEIQFKNVEEQAEKHQVILEKIYFDASKHGWDLSTDEFCDMLEHLKQVDMLYIEHNDRFFRGDPKDPTTIIDALNIYREIFRNKKIIFSIQEGELKMDTLQNVLLMMIKTYSSSERIVVDKKKQKDGIKRTIEKTGRWGPKPKKLNIKEYYLLKEKQIPKKTIAKLLGMSHRTLNKRLHELGLEDEIQEFKGKKK